MAIDFRRWLAMRFGKLANADEISLIDFEKDWSSVSIRNLCFHACVKLVANAIAKCEFRTYSTGAEVKQGEYYLWNVQPNPNIGAPEFMRRLIAQLFTHNEALIFEKRGNLYVAESFTREKKGTKPDVFSGITLDGEEIIRQTTADGVIYIELSDGNVKRVIDSIYTDYNKLLEYAYGNYRREVGQKGIVEIESAPQGTAEDQQKRNELINAQFKPFFEKNNAAIILNKGYKYTDLSKAASSRASPTSRDIRALIDDIADFTATAFCIPPPLVTGRVENTENAVDQFLTFCIDPLADMIQAAINRKRYSENDYLGGSYVKIDTKAVRHIDLFSVSEAYDKLIGGGGWSIDELREVAGDAPLGTPWSKQHWMTKNYARIEEALNAPGKG